jgi:hypothetical protein
VGHARVCAEDAGGFGGGLCVFVLGIPAVVNAAVVVERVSAEGNQGGGWWQLPAAIRFSRMGAVHSSRAELSEPVHRIAGGSSLHVALRLQFVAAPRGAARGGGGGQTVRAGGFGGALNLALYGLAGVRNSSTLLRDVNVSSNVAGRGNLHVCP